MKNIIHILQVAVIVALAASCMETEPAFREGGSRQVSFVAGFVDTKTSCNGDGKVNWEKGDIIRYYTGDGGEILEYKAEEGGHTIPLTATVDDGADFILAVYGGVIDSSYSYSSESVRLLGAVSGDQSGKFGDAHVSVAKSENLSDGSMLVFHNVTTLVKFSLERTDVSYVIFSSNGGEKIHGDGIMEVTVDDSGFPSASFGSTGGSSIKVATDGIGPFYISTLPVVLEEGFTVEMFNQSGVSVGSVAATAAPEFGQNEIIDLGAVDKVEYLYFDNLEDSIPDPVFRNYCLDNFDANGDGHLTRNETESVRQIDIRTDNVESLKGIEYFTNLEELYCRGLYYFSWWNISEDGERHFFDENDVEISGGKLKELNLSENKKLEYIDCSYNKLTSLDLSSNWQLEELCCRFNKLGNLDVSQNIKLRTLDCFDDMLTTIDVRGNSALQSLECSCNELTSIDVTKNLKLEYLRCYENKLTKVDVSNNVELYWLDLQNNRLSNIDVSNNIKLQCLVCSENQLASLDVSNNTELTYLYCHNNKLSSLDVSKNTELTSVYCSHNEFLSLDVRNNLKLKNLSCQWNQLTSLDVSKNLNLTNLICWSNNLTSLDISKNTELTYLDCNDNNLSILDLSHNLNLETVYCNGNDNLSEIWLLEGQTILNFYYNSEISTIKYRE